MGFASAAVMSLVPFGTPAWAQDSAGEVAAGLDEPAAPPPQRVGYAALPGGLHVASAETLPAGTVGIALLSGYGYRKGLLSTDHTFNRAIGTLAVAYAPLPSLSIALSLDGRYDKHASFAAMSDDGYVGDPHLLVRFARPLGTLALGAQLGVWVPGKDAPSIAASAISVDARVLASLDAGFGTLTVDAGFRLDNSAESVDDPTKLSVEDQVSLGVSELNAARFGAQLRIPLGRRAYVGLEGSADVFVGDGAPDPILRGGALAGVALSDTFSVIAFVEAASAPAIEPADALMNAIDLLPYEPAITGGLGVQARFGVARGVATSRSVVVRNDQPAAVAVIETADVTGVVVDDAGKPVVGAKVTVKLKNNTGTAATDDKGAYTVAKLPIGKTVDGKTELDDVAAEVTIEVATRKPATATLTLGKGFNSVPQIALEPLLPPGQLRAVIRNVGTSRPVPGATVTIEPGGITQTAGPDGKFTVDLPPGKYQITVTARGLKQQQLDVNIEQNGVAIKNIDMHR
ncbi:MAG: carboxypeptidase regulatory-like domain-containing protein [Myxococcales bacterium]|nr:carboxypeptidase regulatory-like domain-containing protein [Myxococcales bacterium]